MNKEINILIADDNPNVRQTLTDILGEKGYLVETVIDGYAAMAYLKKKLPHIVILDLMMPHKNGGEIICSIKSVAPNTKIIIYTAFSRYEGSMYASDSMVDKFLLKSANPENLLQAIEELS